jgi:hypothetical protein
MKNDGTVYDRATAKEEQDRRAPTTPGAHELTPAQLELVAGGCVDKCNKHTTCCFVKR